MIRKRFFAAESFRSAARSCAGLRGVKTHEDQPCAFPKTAIMNRFHHHRNHENVAAVPDEQRALNSTSPIRRASSRVAANEPAASAAMIVTSTASARQTAN